MRSAANGCLIFTTMLAYALARLSGGGGAMNPMHGLSETRSSREPKIFVGFFSVKFLWMAIHGLRRDDSRRSGRNQGQGRKKQAHNLNTKCKRVRTRLSDSGPVAARLRASARGRQIVRVGNHVMETSEKACSPRTSRASTKERATVQEAPNVIKTRPPGGH